MSKLRDVTLLFLVKKVDNKTTEICLAMKKRGFGAGRWNGVGGKLHESETIEAAAKRETEEEIGVAVQKMKKVAELTFHFTHNPSWDQVAHVFITEEWVGEPNESGEMRPAWYAVNSIPYESMWPDDVYWLPKVLTGDYVTATFTFGEGDVILQKEVTTTAHLERT